MNVIINENSNSYFKNGSLVIENAISVNNEVYHLVISQEGQDLSQRARPASLNEFARKTALVWQATILNLVNKENLKNLSQLSFEVQAHSGWKLFAQNNGTRVNEIDRNSPMYRHFFHLIQYFEYTQV